MPGLLKLDSEKLESSIGVLQDTFNTQVLEAMTEVASVLKNTGDTNPQVEQCIEACKVFQAQYNTQLDSVNDFIKETEKVYDISEYMSKRAHVGEVSARDTGFKVTSVDPDSVMI